MSRYTHPWLHVNNATATDEECVVCFLAMLESALMILSDPFTSHHAAWGFFKSAAYWAQFRGGEG